MNGAEVSFGQQLQHHLTPLPQSPLALPNQCERPRPAAVMERAEVDADKNTGSVSSSPKSSESPNAAHSEKEKSSAQRWQKEEEDYFRNPQWCEHRVILLLQEAFLPSHRRLKKAFTEGRMSVEEYRSGCREIKTAVTAIKSEYRRTLQRLRDRHASQEELASIASKAVTCVASVYPWSSAGFFLPYRENLLFAQLTTSTSSAAAKATGPAGSGPFMPSRLFTPAAASASTSNSGEPLLMPRKTPAGPARLGGPRPALQPLPIRKDGFTRSVAADGSVVLSSASSHARGPSIGGVSACSPPPPAAVACDLGPVAPKFASPLTTPGSPARQLPLSVTGPIRPEEARYVERHQLMQTARSFCALSLAAVPFVGLRRAAIAQQQTKARLPVVLMQSTATPREPVTAASASVESDAPVPMQLVVTPGESTLSRDAASTVSDGSVCDDHSPLSQWSRCGSFSDGTLEAEAPPSCPQRSRAAPPATTPRARSPPPVGEGYSAIGMPFARRQRPQPTTPQVEHIVKALW